LADAKNRLSELVSAVQGDQDSGGELADVE
jgi:hypothetical protein